NPSGSGPDPRRKTAHAHQALVEAQRETLAAASHELRSPLARIRMAVELLAENGDPGLRARVERDVEDLDELIEEILLASRLSTLERPQHLERIDLQALAAEEAARAGAEFSGEPVTVAGEGRLLARLVRNLLENAARHAPGSTALVEVEAQDGHALLRVLDRGPGVPEAERERIFEPFYRREGRREDRDDDRGVGLGLSLVRQIARRHGGDARCLPRNGGGACFEVRLPIEGNEAAS
ncbi:MAG: HAMP domain-containing sensor histidine kinase, partial [Rhodospirillales bacterium]|nr:HAMP domain-containing sensor histidine kinase [Rhodospirillales bacterium]